MRALPLAILIFVCAWTAAAQIDEQPPVIRRAPSGPVDQPSQGKSTSSKKQSDTMTAEGIVRSIDSKTLEVAIDDGRIFKAAINSNTVFLGPSGKVDPATVSTGTRVRISVKANDDMDLTATSVVIQKAMESTADIAKPEDDAATRKTEDADPDRPVLKRGMPARVARKTDAEEEKDDDVEEEPAKVVTGAKVAAPQSAAEEKDDSLAGALTAENQPELIMKARQANLEFVEHLPNFVCQQYTTRYERQNKIEGFRAKDIISATVVFDDHKEHYDNIKINNRAATTDMMAIKGQRSEGEFGSILGGMFSRRVNTEFRYLHAELFRQVHTKVFAYSVKRETTDWTIAEGGQYSRVVSNERGGADGGLRLCDARRTQASFAGGIVESGMHAG
jgi:hypothetical protein